MSSTSSSACIFCKIIRKEIPGTFVAETDKLVAFMDIRPINHGHVLIVPKEHRQGMLDLSKEESQEMIPLAQRITAALRQVSQQQTADKTATAVTVRCSGTNLLMCDGKTAGQEVFHAHLHVIPRFENDGFKMRFQPEKPTREQLEETGSLISAALQLTDAKDKN